MGRRTEGRAQKQGVMKAEGPSLDRLRQLFVPMLMGIVTTKRTLEAWVREVGHSAVDELLAADAERLAGPKGKHQAERAHNHWGTAPTALSLGGRHVVVERPRVRHATKGEVRLPVLAQFEREDPLPERVVNQILLGVSTRGYEKSLEAPPPERRTKGASKSAASRHLVERTRATMKEQLSRRLDELEIIALMLDGIVIAEHTAVVALGITLDGTKVPLGLWLGSTENARVCTDLLQNLIERGLRVTERILCVIDGGKGLRKSITDVFGDLAMVQRCQVHKRRNVREHLPEKRRAYAAQMMNAAYNSGSAKTARKRLQQLVSWLERNGEDSAAASLREGLEETLTVLKLELPSTLRRSLSCTNAIENVMGTVRRVTRNVKRWRGGEMVRRWTALGMRAAQEHFRRIKGHRDLPMLVRALRSGGSQLDEERDAA